MFEVLLRRHDFYACVRRHGFFDHIHGCLLRTYHLEVERGDIIYEWQRKLDTLFLWVFGMPPITIPRWLHKRDQTEGRALFNRRPRARLGDLAVSEVCDVGIDHVVVDGSVDRPAERGKGL